MIMNIRKPLIFSIAFIVTSCLLINRIPGHDETTSKTRDPYSQGYVAHIDPATGEFIATPTHLAPSQIDEKLFDVLTTSSAGLIEEASPVTGGGIMVNLQGRFQNVFVAALGDSGDITATCKSGTAHRPGDGGGSR
jgi:hypothetical protein